MSRFLLDQGLAPLGADTLRQLGFDAVHVSEIGMERSDDARFSSGPEMRNGYVSLSTTIFTLILRLPGRDALR